MPLPIRENVLAMTPYSPGKPIEEVKRELGLERVIKLASNENPLGPSPKAVAAVRAAADAIHLYPDGSAHDLRLAIGRKFGFPPEQILLGNGGDEILRMLGWVLIDSPEDEVLTADPSFIVYGDTAKIAPCRWVKVPVDAGYGIDLTAMAGRLGERTRIVFLANPNNPTGTVLKKSDFDAFLRDVPDTALVVLDEAYYEFAADLPDFPHAIDYVRAGVPNVVCLRTFSKAYGLAGVRCGYGFAPAELVDAVHRARQPFHVNSLAQAAAIAALEDDEHVARTVANNTRGLDRLAEIVREVGGTPIPGRANFLLADFGRPAGPLFRALLERGVIVRSGEPLGAPTCLRISVGTDEETELFGKAIREALVAEAQR
ncbi:MAG: histidinol-phosphate transaminase [Fimbriimonadaceae bacterium]